MENLRIKTHFGGFFSKKDFRHNPVLIFSSLSTYHRKIIRCIKAFKNKADLIDSNIYILVSNEVLLSIADDLETVGFEVEKIKLAEDRIPVPILFGINNQPSKSFLADAIHINEKIVIKVEAGRAVVNNQFLKDIFQASMMVDIEYLVLAVRNTYRNSDDFMKFFSFLDTLYTSQRITLLLRKAFY